MTYEPVIGLEIHAELKTRTKMFCDSLNDPDETRPNMNVCPICMGHPGTLPVINRAAVEKVIQVGLAIEGAIAPVTRFDRKNYFYPDLPKGYQISQYDHPLVENGAFEVPDAVGAAKRIRIRRVHLEEDTGRSVHVGGPSTGSGRSATLIDFNRAGMPLLELVTEPDFSDASEARVFAEAFQQILQHLGASDANMEKGEMRIEANVSVRPAGARELGTKVELKNINSFRFVEDAIRAEVARQIGLAERGGKIVQETRGWDAAKGVTVSQRLKEESKDYRYFPEPDLPPLAIPLETVEELRRSLPELPAEKLRRFRDEYRIDAKLAGTLVRDRHIAGFFEAAISELQNWLKETGGKPNDPKSFQLAANYLTTDVVKLLSEKGIPIAGSPLTPENFAELITYLAEGRLSSRAAKDVLAEMVASGTDPSVIIEERKLWQISETDELAAAVAGTIAANPKAAEDFRRGRREALQFLLGRVMKDAPGANPETVRALLEEKLRD
ncbi:MAG: Asp-tRNA(Asn)/Glu-tRNA(Gln) amidotransferase subunit GatB [bacterium]|nr:Asp-tRNA(Asn)/Glu-tRNA(Gln) amidotransferase subunit GatB [bacterium]